jgi:hypothetical protein
MPAPNAAFKYQTSTRLDVLTNPHIPPKGPGSSARAWVRSLGLSRGEAAIALAWAWYCNADWQAWPSRHSIAVRAGYGVRQVQKLTERLIGLGVLIETGSQVTRGKDGRPIKRTRLYRLAVGRELVPVVPAMVRRRLARLAGESALSPDSKVHKVHSRKPEKPTRKRLENEPIESAPSALSTGRESAQSAHNPSSNPGNAVGAPQAAYGLGQGATPTASATNQNLTGAAREAQALEAKAALAAIADRRRAVLFAKPAPAVVPADWLVPAARLSADRFKDWRRSGKRT